MQWPRSPFFPREPRRTAEIPCFSPRSVCVTAWWMIAEGGAEDMQPGQVWHEPSVEYTCTGFAHGSLSIFVPPSLRLGAQTRDLWGKKSGRFEGPPSSVTFDRWRLTAHCFFFPRRKIWRFKSCLNQRHWTFLDTCAHKEPYNTWLSVT